MGGEGGGVVGDADEDGAAVGGQIINTVRDADADGIGTEIVIIDPHGRAVPFGAGVFEIADQFAFLGIDADDGKPLALEASP